MSIKVSAEVQSETQVSLAPEPDSQGRKDHESE